MNIETLQSFLMWCTIINVSLMMFWTLCCTFALDWVYRTQRMFFPISKDVFTIVMYSFLAIFKILVVVFNLVPFIAILIIR